MKGSEHINEMFETYLLFKRHLCFVWTQSQLRCFHSSADYQYLLVLKFILQNTRKIVKYILLPKDTRISPL